MLGAISSIRSGFSMECRLQGPVAGSHCLHQSRASREFPELHGTCNVHRFSCLFVLRFLIRVIDSGRFAYNKITGLVEKAKETGGEILVGGSGMNTRPNFRMRGRLIFSIRR